MVVAFGIFLIDCMTAELSVLEIILRSLIVTGNHYHLLLKLNHWVVKCKSFFGLAMMAYESFYHTQLIW